MKKKEKFIIVCPTVARNYVKVVLQVVLVIWKLNVLGVEQI